MSDRSYRPHLYWIVVTVVAVPVLYVASFGPAVWLSARGTVPEIVVKCVYWPVLCQRIHLSNSLGPVVAWYGSLGVPSGKIVVFTIGDLEGDTISPAFGTDREP